MKIIGKLAAFFLLLVALFTAAPVFAQGVKATAQTEWEKTLELAGIETTTLHSFLASFSRAMGQGTRRLDVETKWLREVGVVAAKDMFTADQYHKRENNSEEKINRVREPGAAFARKLLD